MNIITNYNPIMDKLRKKYVDEKTEEKIKEYIKKKNRPENGTLVISKFHMYYVKSDDDIIIPFKELINTIGPLIEVYKRVSLYPKTRNLIITESELPKSKNY